MPIIYNRIINIQSARMQELSFDNSQSAYVYSNLDLVWAKITGYPWWPGRIAALPPPHSAKYKVEFLGDSTHAFVPANKLAPFAQYRCQYSTPKKLIRNFTKALNEADQLYTRAASIKKLPADSSSHLLPLQHSQNSIIIEISQDNQIQNYPLCKPHDSSLNQGHFSHFEQNHPLKKTKLLLKQKQQIMNELLQKYKLNHIPRLFHQQIKTIKNRGKKRDERKKRPNNEVRMEWKLAKKIDKVLKVKRVAQGQRKKIIHYIVEELKELNAEWGMYCNLFHWLSCTDKEIILSQYEEWWKGEGEKSTQQF